MINESDIKPQEFSIDELTDRYTLRKSQEKVMSWMDKPFEKKKKFIILEAPPGVGKSLMSQLYIKYYIDNINRKGKFDLLTCTKNLQQQYLDSFSYISNLWGKNNYRCDRHDCSCEQGKILNKNEKQDPCEDCPHTTAFGQWAANKISMTNFHIHGLFSLFQPFILEERKANCLIVDECHTLEPTINGFVSFILSKKNWKNFVSVSKSNKWEENIFQYNDISEVVTFLEKEYIPALNYSKDDLVSKSIRLSGKKLDENLKTQQDIDKSVNAVNVFLIDYSNNVSKWVADKKVEKGDISWNIQPLWTDKILKKNIWEKYEHVFLMSGTIVDYEMFCKVNGIDKDDVSFMKLNSPFPLQNRPIYYIPKGRMSYKQKEDTWKTLRTSVKKIMDKYEGKKGLIHTGNYEIWDWVARDIRSERLTMASPDARQRSIDEHVNSDKDSVLVSPSMMQGLDLYDDRGRFQILIKVPYPSLASKVNKERFKENPKWYAWITVMDIIQSYGRIIRSETDYGDMFILDSCFSDIIANYANMLPKYFIDAIKKIG